MRGLIHPSLRDGTTTRLEVQALKRLAKINRRYAANSLTTSTTGNTANVYQIHSD
jgi:hypothetical protein